MGILIALAPFIIFAIFSRSLATSSCLWIAPGVSLIPLLRNLAIRHSAKLLEVGSLALFAGLAIYTGFTHVQWGVWTVRALVHGGLLTIVLLSLLIRRPFTLQYARDQVPEDVSKSAAFRRMNYIITSVWAVAMSINLVRDLLLQHRLVSEFVGVGTMIVVVGFAFWFTVAYPKDIAAQRRPSKPL